MSKFSAEELTPAELRHNVRRYPVYFLYLGAGQLVTVYFAIVGFLTVGERVAQETRAKYLQSPLMLSVGGLEELGIGRSMSPIKDGVSKYKARYPTKRC